MHARQCLNVATNFILSKKSRTLLRIFEDVKVVLFSKTSSQQNIEVASKLFQFINTEITAFLILYIIHYMKIFMPC